MAKKVLVGMSGGVDSSVAALLLCEQGYEVAGATMRLAPGEENARRFAQEADDAEQVARRLGIEHFVWDFTREFEREVIGRFARDYQAGRTPSPCVVCNRTVKFGLFLEKALSMGFDAVATGHYALLEKQNGRWLLRRALSPKDQSYFLYGLSQRQLSHAMMPLATIEKERARALAEKAGLLVARKADSQEICFVPGGDYAAFLEEYTGALPPPGDFIDARGQKLGRHRGITHYTIGQRKGLGVTFGRPMYVTGIDAANNTVTLGEEGSQYHWSLTAGELNFIPFDRLERELRVEAKIRCQARPAPATLRPLEGEKARLLFDQPQRSVTPGQSVVFYQGDLVVGGGVIEEAWEEPCD